MTSIRMGAPTITASEAEAWFRRAAADHRQGRNATAIQAYEKALALNPRHGEAWFFLGNIYGERGNHEAATRCYRSAVELRPQWADAVRNLGATLQILERPAEAVACYERFLRVGRGTADILQNFGNALADTGMREQAIAAYREALRLDPTRAMLNVRIGNLLEELGAPEAALPEYEQALASDPGLVPAVRCLGAALADQGRPDEALACYRRAAHVGDAGLALRAATVLPAVPASLEELREYRRRYEAGITELAQRGLHLEDPPAQAGCPTFFLAYHGESNRSLNTKLAQLHERACPSLAWVAPHCRAGRRKPGRLRVGFISRFLHSHSIGKTTHGLLEKLPRDELEVMALFVPPIRDDELARKIRAAADRALDVPGTLQAARRAIAGLELDVLFYQDIGMEPFTYFLAFSRLAPVQCTSFGHPDTTGIGAMDYFVSSELFEPADAQAHYSERLVLLKDAGTLAYYHRPNVQAGRREEFGLPGETNLYVCPQSLFKFHPQFDALLGAILRGDPRGRLVLIDGAAPALRERLQARLGAAFADVAERIVFLPRQSGAAFSRLVAACDVMLDTLHFNGMNTSLEAFAAGTPVVTLPAALQRGRHTAAMYRAMGLEHAVAKNADDYVRVAIALAHDAERRRSLRREILARNDALFENARVVSEFARFFVEARPWS